jgi:nanoRNase/pAp phosphatase (c-di-AMP/oligoRNAs hydrolase)
MTRPDASAVRSAAALLTAAREVTLLAHVNPDADALGSALALGIALHRRGAVVRVSFAAPADVPETLRPLDVLGLVVPPNGCRSRRRCWCPATPRSPPGWAGWPTGWAPPGPP